MCSQLLSIHCLSHTTIHPCLTSLEILSGTLIFSWVKCHVFTGPAIDGCLGSDAGCVEGRPLVAPAPSVWPHPSFNIHCWKSSTHAGHSWHQFIKVWLLPWVASKTMVVPSVWTSGNQKAKGSSAGVPKWNVQWLMRLGLLVILENPCGCPTLVIIYLCFTLRSSVEKCKH